MSKKIALLASHWTLTGDIYPKGPVQISPIPFRDRVEAAAKAGYTGMGLGYLDVMANKARLGLSTMKDIFADNGIINFEVEMLGDWFATGESKSASDRVKNDLLEVASCFGARNIKVAPRIGAEACEIEHYSQAFAEVCVDAKKVGTDVAIEVLPFSNIPNLQVARAVIAGAGQDNGGLCIDIWHMARGGVSNDEIAQLPKAYIKSVELNDARREIVGDLWNDTVHHRLLPGEGVLNPKAFIAAVLATGFDSFWSVEILSAEHRVLPIMEQARRSYSASIAQFPNV